MSNLTFRLEGKEKVQKKLGTDTIKKPLAETIKKVTVFLDRSVKVSTPVDTARLRSGITQQITADYGKVATNVEYAPYVEYGTKFMQARHVTEGSSSRVLGKGMFTKGLELLNDKMGDFLRDLGDAIKVRFG